MSTYATEADLVAYVAGTVYETAIPATADERTRLLELAERDLDLEAWPLVRRRPGATKLDPGWLVDSGQREGLTAATCAQAVYRVEMGPEHFVRAQRQRVQTRTLSQEGRLPIVGPAAQRELAAASLWRLTTSTRSRWAMFDESDPDDWQRT